MKIFKIIKEFFCPKMYSGIEIAEMGKNIKFDYYPEAVDLIYSSSKLTDSEKNRTEWLIISFTVTLKISLLIKMLMNTLKGNYYEFKRLKNFCGNTDD